MAQAYMSSAASMPIVCYTFSYNRLPVKTLSQPPQRYRIQPSDATLTSRDEQYTRPASQCSCGSRPENGGIWAARLRHWLAQGHTGAKSGPNTRYCRFGWIGRPTDRARVVLSACFLVPNYPTIAGPRIMVLAGGAH